MSYEKKLLTCIPDATPASVERSDADRPLNRAFPRWYLYMQKPAGDWDYITCYEDRAEPVLSAVTDRQWEAWKDRPICASRKCWAVE